FPPNSGFDADLHMAADIAATFWNDAQWGFNRSVNSGREGANISVDEWMLEQPVIRAAIEGYIQTLLFGAGSPAAKTPDSNGIVRI
ncbi:hypothetical protein OY671_010978, partial [Metschnikowia pulcherrima]